MTEKQKKFCKNVVSGMSYTDSYINAYNSKSKKSAGIESSKLMKREDIKEYIDQLKKPIITRMENKIISEREKKRAILWEIIDQADNITDRLRAMDILNKMDSDYVNINKNIDTRSADIINLETDQLKKLVNG